MLPQLLRVAFFHLIGISFLSAQSLRVATVNFWSGLDYQGAITMGEYEPDSTREHRLEILIQELKQAAPDIVALQESNPVHEVASRLAGELDYDYIYQRTNGGVKLGSIGLPFNMNEGLVLLAKKGLNLKLVDVWDLSKTFGAFGNIFSFHFQDQNIALVGSVVLDGVEITLINTHITSAVPDDSLSRARLSALLGLQLVNAEQRESSFQRLRDEARKRAAETEALLAGLDQLQGKPFVLLGDFNATYESPEIQLLLQKEQLVDVARVRGMDLPTWDAQGNGNVRYSLENKMNADVMDLGGSLGTWYDSLSRRIDYVFLSSSFSPSDVGKVQLLLNRARNGLYASDHYGVMAEISLKSLERTPGREEIQTPESELEILPILTYDTDVGFGYGGKAFLLNQLGRSESFDVTAFNSTKGERWYRLVFSVPDFELRQGRQYQYSFDLIIDYDKYLRNNFFGTGNRSQSQNREVYTKEPLEIQAVVSRGFSSRLVGHVGVKYRIVRNFDYEPGGLFLKTLDAVNHGRSSGFTFLSSFRYDSRNSFVNPSDGNVVQLDLEAGTSGFVSDYSFTGVALSLQSYHVLFYPKTIFAARLLGQAIGGANLPIHTYAALGGNKTLRGYPQDRFLDRAALVSNAEVRFPLVWRLNGVLFVDAGKVSGSFGQLNIFDRGWNTNLGFGLRFIMDTFVVRADLGLSREGSGFYFNFGHAF